MGGIDYGSVEIVCNYYNVPQGQRSTVMDMVIRLIEVYREHSNEDSKEGKLNDLSVLQKG